MLTEKGCCQGDRHAIEFFSLCEWRPYRRLDRGDESLDDELSTDPVCGMRIRRGESAGQYSYRGHLYFFCAEECQRKFEKEPSHYVWFHE